jgi:hypothetical protein
MATRDRLSVTARTSLRDSAEILFDYEDTSVPEQTFDVDEGAVCFPGSARSSYYGSVDVLPSSAAVKGLSLCSLQRDGDAFSVEGPGSLWLSARGLPQQQRRLHAGGMFRLGRYDFRVRHLATSQDGISEGNSWQGPSCNACEECEDPTSKVCRICLMEGEEGPEAEPLVAPCSCKGSVEHVHWSCLQRWVGMRFAKDRSQHCLRISKPCCELCKQAFPMDMRTASGARPLLELPERMAPFVLVEQGVRLTRPSGQVFEPEALYAVSLAGGRDLTVGRSRRSDIHIEDISVSRQHARVRFQEGAFVLEDNDARFGTLLQAQGPLRVQAGQSLTLQAGSSILNLAMVASECEVRQSSTSTQDFLTGSVESSTSSQEVLCKAEVPRSVRGFACLAAVCKRR